MRPLANRTTINRAITTDRTYESSPDAYTKLIEAYGFDRALNPGRLLHAHLITTGLIRLTHFAAKLIAFYTECGQLVDARRLFERIPTSNVRRWIVLIGAYAKRGFYHEAMSVFSEMQVENLRHNKFVLPSILKSCAHLLDQRTGEKIHAVILRYNFEADAFTNSSLIDMYSKCGEIGKARRVFDRLLEKDSVVLNAMVLGYSHHGFVKEAILLVRKMQLIGVKTNVVTWNTLISGFSKSGDESAVSELLEAMQINGIQPDVVSWTSIISGFVQSFRNKEALHTFKQMINFGFYPSSVTVSSILPACSTIADLRRGKEIHGYSLLIGVEEDIFVKSALIDMYSKCGSISEAKRLFYSMPKRNTVTWNSMMFGYANNGYSTEAIDLFNIMKGEGVKCDHLTYTAALTACSHGGKVKLGISLLLLMKEKYGIEPRLEHYACMVDLLGRAGKVTEAYDLIKKMPVVPDMFVWGALLGACKNYGNIEIGEIAAKHLVKLEPESAGSSLLLSNLYADTGRWDNVAKLKKMMKKRKLEKFPGCSWVEA